MMAFSGSKYSLFFFSLSHTEKYKVQNIYGGYGSKMSEYWSHGISQNYPIRDIFGGKIR